RPRRRGRRRRRARVSRGRAGLVLGQLRQLRAERRRDCALPRERRPRVVDVPRARRRREAPRVSPRGSVAHGQHAEGAAHRAGACRVASGVAGVTGSPQMDSPNIDSLDQWATEVRKVEKPWGYELIWAATDIYVGKVLFVKAGHSLSLQFHRVKDESWFVQ